MLVFCSSCFFNSQGLRGKGEGGMLFYQGLFWAVYICSRTREGPNGEKWSLAVLWEFVVIFRHGMWMLCSKCGRKWLEVDWCQVYFESCVKMCPFIGFALWLNSLWVGCVACALCFRYWCFWCSIRSGALVPGVFNRGKDFWVNIEAVSYPEGIWIVWGNLELV
jgi:hypothetical protein